jgi:hypothetical protein
MKVLLMHRDRDFALMEDASPHTKALMQDLELETLLQAMAAGDEFLLGVAKSAVLTSLHDLGAILYRQSILADCMEHPDIVREIYAIAVEAIEREKSVWGWMSMKYPEGTLHRCIEVLQIFVELLRRLKDFAAAHEPKFRSEEFKRFFTMITSEISDEYLRTVDEHLQRLKFRQGLLMSAQLGEGNKGINHILRKPPDVAQSWYDRLLSWVRQRTDPGAFIYEVHERDEAGLRALSELRSLGIAHIAAPIAQSTDHILAFFRMLRLELGFYIGCVNLLDRLLQKHEPFCLPVPFPAAQTRFVAQGLFDVCLSLNSQGRVVGNDVTADSKSLVMITGANRGGKSTFLRSIGLAQLMMQCGMFVTAESFQANLCFGLFTHFKRKEDITMKSGKLDEELSRISAIIDQIAPHSMVLFNESFASTNEREGSEIASQIIRALLEAQVKVIYVTHMFDLAQNFYLPEPRGLFLRAERLADGQRTFRLIPGEPLSTSYGQDLYRKIFDAELVAGTS